MKKSIWLFAILFLASTLFVACDNSTSVEVEQEEEQVVLRALATNIGENETSISFSVLITNILGQESLGGNAEFESDTNTPLILGASEAGATAIEVSVTTTEGGPVRLSIEMGEVDEDGSVEFEEILFVNGGLNQTVSLEYTTN